jgi:hypothetical protein
MLFYSAEMHICRMHHHGFDEDAALTASLYMRIYICVYIYKLGV